MKKEDFDKIKLIKDQIKKSSKSDRWCVEKTPLRDSYRHEDLLEIKYSNVLEDNGSNIRITLKYRDSKLESSLISLKVENRYDSWDEYDIADYGFSNFEFRRLKRRIDKKAKDIADMEKERIKENRLQRLVKSSEKFIKLNTSSFRDDKIDKILN